MAQAAQWGGRVIATRQQVATRQKSCGEITAHYLQGLRSLEPQLQSFLCVDEINALRQAAAIDERLARGESAGPLAGVVMGIKVCIASHAWTVHGPNELGGDLVDLPPWHAGQPVHSGNANYCGQPAAAGLHPHIRRDGGGGPGGRTRRGGGADEKF